MNLKHQVNLVFQSENLTKLFNLEEEIALMNYLKVELEETDRLAVMQSTKSIFTTDKYKLSPKRSNHWALLPNGMYFILNQFFSP